MKGDLTTQNKGEKYLNSAQVFTYFTNSLNAKTKTNRDGIGINIDNHLSNYFISKTENKHSNFIYVYFWYAYVLLLSPFRFQKVGEGNYKIYRWIPQQILCGFSNILSVLRLFTAFRTTVNSINHGGPISYFLLFCETSSFIFKTTMFRLFWMKAEAYEKLINFLSSNHIVPYNPFKIESMKAITIFCGAYTILSFLRVAAVIFEFGFADYWRQNVANARYTFFICNSSNLSNVPPVNELTPLDSFLALIQALSIISRSITGFFVDLCILLHVLSLWTPCMGFVNTIYAQIPEIAQKKIKKQDSALPFNEGLTVLSPFNTDLKLALKQFEALKSLSICVGEAIGAAIAPYLGEALFYYAIYFDNVLLTSDVVLRIVLMFFCTSAVCILVLSAEVVRKIRWFKPWLSVPSQLTKIDQNHLAVILDDLARDGISVTASGMFTINYSFVGAVTSVLVTYFIIRLEVGKHNF